MNQGFRQYLLFGGQVYYARGGWKDFIASSFVIEDLIDVAATSDIEWAQVVEMGLGDGIFIFNVRYIAKREDEFDWKSKMIWTDKFDLSESN